MVRRRDWMGDRAVMRRGDQDRVVVRRPGRYADVVGDDAAVERRIRAHLHIVPQNGPRDSRRWMDPRVAAVLAIGPRGGEGRRGLHVVLDGADVPEARVGDEAANR